MLKYLIVLFGLLLTIQAPARDEVKWKFDKAHSKVQFNITHMVINDVVGDFKSFDGFVATNKPEDLSDGKIEFTINVKSINTDNEKRDAHLKSDDFFNADKYPTITFKSKSIRKVADNKYKIKGDLTMRDVTKEVTLDAVYNGSIKEKDGKIRQGYKVNGTINRFDYNLKWNALLETGGAVVGKEVRILCDVELVQE